MINQLRRILPALFAVVTACNAPVGSTPVVTEIPSGAVNVAWSNAGAVRVGHAYYSGFRQSARVVVDNDSEWRTLWSTYTANLGSPPPLPAIDFTSHEVIVAALGERNSGGYDIAISRIAATSDYLYVELTSTRPGSRCGTTAALTQPVDMVRIPREHPPVMFIEKVVVNEC